jgi:hypothetical protein
MQQRCRLDGDAHDDVGARRILARRVGDAEAPKSPNDLCAVEQDSYTGEIAVKRIS